jgi:hypothetical protein
MSLLQCSAAAVLGAALSLSLRTADAPEEEPTDYHTREGVPKASGRGIPTLSSFGSQCLKPRIHELRKS